MVKVDNEKIILEELRRSIKQGYAKRANIYQNECNKSEAELRNIFFTIAVAIITIASPIFTSDKLTGASNITNYLIATALVSLFLSIIFGLADFAITIRFYMSATEVKSLGEAAWSKVAFPTFSDFENMADESESIDDKSEHTPLWALILQGIFVIIALLLLLITGVANLF